MMNPLTRPRHFVLLAFIVILFLLANLHAAERKLKDSSNSFKSSSIKITPETVPSSSQLQTLPPAALKSPTIVISVPANQSPAALIDGTESPLSSKSSDREPPKAPAEPQSSSIAPMLPTITAITQQNQPATSNVELSAEGKSELNKDPALSPSTSTPGPFLKQNNFSAAPLNMPDETQETGDSKNAKTQKYGSHPDAYKITAGSPAQQQTRIHEIFKNAGSSANLALEPETINKPKNNQANGKDLQMSGNPETTKLLPAGLMEKEKGYHVQVNSKIKQFSNKADKGDQSKENQPSSNAVSGPDTAVLSEQETIAVVNDLLKAEGIESSVDDIGNPKKVLDFLSKVQSLGGELNQQTWEKFESQGADAVLEEMVRNDFGIPDNAGLDLQDLLNGIADGNLYGVDQESLHGFLQDWKKVNDGLMTGEDLMRTWAPGTMPGESGVGTNSSDSSRGGLDGGIQHGLGSSYDANRSDSANIEGSSAPQNDTADNQNSAGGDNSGPVADPLDSPLTGGTNQPSSMDSDNSTRDATPDSAVVDIDTTDSNSDTTASTSTNNTSSDQEDIQRNNTSPDQEDMSRGVFDDEAEAFRNQGDNPDAGVFTVESYPEDGPASLQVGDVNDPNRAYAEDENGVVVGWGMSSPDSSDSSGSDEHDESGILNNSDSSSSSDNDSSSSSSNDDSSSCSSNDDSGSSSSDDGSSSGSSDDDSSSSSSDNDSSPSSSDDDSSSSSSDNDSSSSSSDDDSSSSSSDDDSSSSSSDDDSSSSSSDSKNDSGGEQKESDDTSMPNPDKQKQAPSKEELAAFIEEWRQSLGGKDKVIHSEEGAGPSSHQGFIRVTREQIKNYLKTQTENQILTTGEDAPQNGDAPSNIPFGRGTVSRPAGDLQGTPSRPPEDDPLGRDRHKHDPSGGGDNYSGDDNNP